MNRYIIPKIICAFGTLVIFIGIFLSKLNSTFGDFLISFIYSFGITIVLLSFAILTFKMKTAHKKKIKKAIKCRTVEIFSLVLFIILGMGSLLIFNHSITIWMQSNTIQKELNIRQLENMFPEYENYANQRATNYENLLNEAIRYKKMRYNELSNLGFVLNSNENLESQRDRKVKKQRQILYPHIYNDFKKSISDSIIVFIQKVENAGVIATLPKQINSIELCAKSWENQLVYFSNYKMKGEEAKIFQFESTFGNVKNILTNSTDYLSSKRIVGYCIGIVFLLCMLFPYFWGNRSIKISKK